MLTILPYAPEHAPVFDRLNRAWISELFTIEPFDDFVLKNPEQSIITPGGEVWFAAWNGEVIGAAALLVGFMSAIWLFSASICSAMLALSTACSAMNSPRI